nr:GGDEF domain-containing protein [Shewanella sp. NIFS-20-20]
MSQRELLVHQLELEEQVAIRTYELECANEKLQQLATLDGLTSLNNRRYCEQLFVTAQEYCQRNHAKLAVVLLDLDHFKTINDNYGHLAGDECLRQVAALLKQHFRRETDIIGRYGGEEFLLILPMYDQTTLMEHLEQFRQHLEQLAILYAEHEPAFYVATSIGALICEATFSANIDKWLYIADENLYRAKEMGRNQVICTKEDSQVSSVSIG